MWNNIDAFYKQNIEGIEDTPEEYIYIQRSKTGKIQYIVTEIRVVIVSGEEVRVEIEKRSKG